MASIQTQISIIDRMSAPLQHITAAVEQVTSSLQGVDGAINQGFHTGAFDDARRSIDLANEELRQMQENIRRNTNEQQRHNQSTDGLAGRLKGIAATYASLYGMQKLVSLSDNMTQTTARLNLLVTDDGSLDELEQKIMASAQRSRSAYLDTASAVAKLGLNAGNAFDHDMDQIIAFMEQINKQFVIGGASAVEQSNAMIQLTQAMAAGALRGEELNSILDAAPGIARAIEEYMGVAEGSIKNYAEQGLVTAEVVKNAMFAMADETNAKFESMPMTWGQVFTMAGNIALQVLQPLLNGINWLANNISIIGPLVLGVGASFAIFQIAAHWTQILTLATQAATAAQAVFNAVMAANPLIKIAMILAIVIGAIYAGVAAWNHFTGASLSATGIIMGAVYTLGSFIFNGIVLFYNAIIALANFIMNVFKHPVAAVQRLFWDMVLNVLGYIEKLAQGIENLLNKIPGVEVNLTSGLTDFINSKTKAVAEASKAAGYKEYFSPMEFDDYTESFKKGYEKGATWGNKLKNTFSGGSQDFRATDFANHVGDIANKAGDIAGNTGAMKNSLDATKEDLKYLRDIAEQDVINRFTTAEIKIEQTNHNQISEKMDLDGVMSGLTDAVNEAIEIMKEGVPA